MEKLSMECLVGAVANKTVVSASPKDVASRSATRPRRARAHHVVVTDAEGFFLGIVSSWDVARDVGRGWELPFWEEFFDRVRRPRIRGGGGGRGTRDGAEKKRNVRFRGVRFSRVSRERVRRGA